MADISCRHKAMDYLARREHSRYELANKLKLKDYPLNEIELTLDKLAEDQLQSDLNFAEAYVSARSKRGFGPVKIGIELSQRGISDSMAHSTIASSGINWNEIASQQQQKKFRQLPSDYKDKAKQARFLQYRGFDYEHINGVFSLDDA